MLVRTSVGACLASVIRSAVGQGRLSGRAGPGLCGSEWTDRELFYERFPLLCFAGMPVCVCVQRCEVKARAEISPVWSHNFQTSTIWRGKKLLLMFLEMNRARVAT